MTTLENTISMMKSLPETDLLEIQKFTVKLLQRKNGMTDAEADGAVGRFLKPMAEDDFLRDIAIAEKQFSNGEYQEMGEAIDEICQELKI